MVDKEGRREMSKEKCPECDVQILDYMEWDGTYNESDGQRMVARVHKIDGMQCLRNQLFQKDKMVTQKEQEIKRLEELVFAYDQTRIPLNPVHVRLVEENKRRWKVLQTITDTILL